MPDANHGAPTSGRLGLLTAAVVLFVLALALVAFALVLPVSANKVSSIHYRQSGQFSYSGKAPTGSVYGDDGVTTGSPIITSLVREIKVRFAYTVTDAATESIHGSHRMDARIDLGSGMVRTIPVSTRQQFDGAAFVDTGTFHTAELQTMVTQMRKAIGDYPSAVTVTFIPTVKATGKVRGHSTDLSFHPKLAFSFSGTTLSLAGNRTDSSAGDSSSTDTVLRPSRTGTIATGHIVDATMPFPLVHVTVLQARFAGGVAALVLLGLGLWLARPFLSRDRDADSPERIQALYGDYLVQVDALSPAEGPVAEVPRIADLVELAKRYETMIIHLPDGDGDCYLLWDNGLFYRHRVPHAAETRRGRPFPTASA